MSGDLILFVCVVVVLLRERDRGNAPFSQAYMLPQASRIGSFSLSVSKLEHLSTERPRSWFHE